jgi:2-phospho-L-lactate guanylyltransferase
VSTKVIRPPWWTVAVAVKPLNAAKSRLGGVLAPEQRSELAAAMALDVVCAVQGAVTVNRCLVVTADRRIAADARRFGAEVLLEGVPMGLNSAFRLARDHVGSRPLAVLVADVPGVTSTAIDDVLRLVPDQRPAVVGDLEGTGTTMLAGLVGTTLRPRFGPASLRRHVVEGALDLSSRAAAGLRHDVDDWPALRELQRSATTGGFTRRWFAASALDFPNLVPDEAAS